MTLKDILSLHKFVACYLCIDVYKLELFTENLRTWNKHLCNVHDKITFWVRFEISKIIQIDTVCHLNEGRSSREFFRGCHLFCKFTSYFSLCHRQSKLLMAHEVILLLWNAGHSFFIFYCWRSMFTIHGKYFSIDWYRVQTRTMFIAQERDFLNRIIDFH